MTQQQMFSTSYLLKNNVKGYLQKFKKNNISSTYKFKSKINNHRLIKDINYNSPNKDGSSHQMSPIQRQKLNQDKKISTFRIDHFHFEYNCLNKAQSPKNITSQLQKSKNHLKQFLPIFPQIQNKKIKTSKLNKLGQTQQENKTSIMKSIQKNSIQSNNKTIQNGFYQKINLQFEDLIRKQVLKTQNQPILKKGHFKFDQTQAFFGTSQYRKKFCSTKKRRKKYQIQIEPARQQSPLQKLFAIEGPEAKSVSLVPISTKSQQIAVAKQRIKMKQRYSYQKISQKIKEGIGKKEEPIHVVKGWDNQDYSNSSQAFGQNVEEIDKPDNRYKSFKSERFY